MTSAGTRPESKAWLWIPFLWLAIGFVDATQTVVTMRSEGMHHDWMRLFLVGAAGWLVWIPATMCILALENALPILGSRRAAWIAHASLVLLIAPASAAWTSLLQVWFNPVNDSPPPGFLPNFTATLYGSVLSSAVLYAVVLMIRNVLVTRERQAEQRTEMAQLNERLAHAQLSALRNQIEPHFLFNALNSIAGLIREGRSDAAVEMVIALSGFLRRTLTGAARQEVPLSEEIEFARQYLAVQKVRFAGRLQFDIDVPNELEAACVPNLILQPLVENAVVHGVAKTVRPGTVRVAAVSSDGTLTLRVSNDGPPLRGGVNSDGGGIGLANVRARLEGLYGEAFSFDLHDGNLSGVEASICIPLCIARATALQP